MKPIGKRDHFSARARVASLKSHSFVEWRHKMDNLNGAPDKSLRGHEVFACCALRASAIFEPNFETSLPRARPSRTALTVDLAFGHAFG